MLGVRLGVVGILAREDVKILTVYVDLSVINQLNLNTKNLEVSSVQNKHKAKTRSQGASLGIGSSGVNSVGFNQSKADENSKTVLLC
jgi:hypothetical protein